MLALAPASAFGRSNLGDYAATLRNNPTAARDHLLAFLNSPWLKVADDWVVVITDEAGYGISRDADNKIIKIAFNAYTLLNAAAENAGGAYPMLKVVDQPVDVTQRIGRLVEMGTSGRVLGVVGQVGGVRALTQSLVDKLTTRLAQMETPPETTRRYPKEPGWKTWALVGGAAVIVGGAAALLVRRR